MRVLIYQDYVHNNGMLHQSLSRSLGAHAVNYCDSDDILNGCLDKNVNLFIIPGGADLYYGEKLNGAGNAAIRRYVEAGGSYLGICAGAYYACRSIIWAKDTTQEITGPRELSFYDGTATGPLSRYIEHLDKSWYGAAEITYDQKKLAVCYIAGPAFSEPKNPDDVLARFDNGTPAIVQAEIGKGLVILSSPHIERIMPHAENALYQHRNGSHTYDTAIYKKLAPHAHAQQKLWGDVLEKLIQRTDKALKSA